MSDEVKYGDKERSPLFGLWAEGKDTCLRTDGFWMKR